MLNRSYILPRTIVFTLASSITVAAKNFAHCLDIDRTSSISSEIIFLSRNSFLPRYTYRIVGKGSIRRKYNYDVNL